MRGVSLGIYLPDWVDDQGSPVAGKDEDTVTFAVSAGRLAIHDPTSVERVVVVTPRPSMIVGLSRQAMAVGLGLHHDTPVEVRLGGAAAALDAIVTSQPNTLLVGVDSDSPAGSGAMLVPDTSCLKFEGVTRVGTSLPTDVRTPDGTHRVYFDPRLQRDRVVRPAVSHVAGPSDPKLVVGLGATKAVKRSDRATSMPTTGASAAVFALAELLVDVGEGDRLVAVDETGAIGVTVNSGQPAITRHNRSFGSLFQPTHQLSGEIPLSMAAYSRALVNKAGLIAERCECGVIAFPPRTQCLSCGRFGPWVSERLPRLGQIYTAVTVHVPVPALSVPYDLVIVELSEEVRVLAPTTGVPAGSVSIGDTGELVFRRLSTRQGVPDYGYAFRPGKVDEEG